ncbi:MAG TPA: DUF4352 domain-containing protein, partial [Chloroflexota bacterium]|nr:DUF4352 domain-containing protein [Chloroflexota bacterium]
MPIAKVGETITSGGVGLTANSVNKTASLGQFLKASPGKIYAVVDVTIENTGRDKEPYNPLYFKAKDADGYEYNGSLIGDDKALKSGELAAGEKARGTVGFEIPDSAKGLVMSYQ